MKSRTPGSEPRLKPTSPPSEGSVAVRDGTVWDQFLGHPRVAAVLKGAAAHPTGTYLFVGAPGVGKRNAARVFSAALVCPEACGECNTCRRVLGGLHPDVTILQPEGYTFPVEVLRATAQAAAQTPIEAEHRVFIIQESDRIPERSQNALLKALEEPNRTVVWILLASAVQPFLPTILSRCQVVDFPPIAEESMLALIRSQFGLADAEAERLVRISRGDLNAAARLAEDPDAPELRSAALRLAANTRMSVGEALAAADEVKGFATAARERMERQQAEELARLEEVSAREGQSAWRKRLMDRNKRTLRRVETEILIDFLSWLGSAFRDLAAASAGAGPEALIAYDFAGLLAEAAGDRPTKFWIDRVEDCLEAQLALRNNASPPLVIESVLLRLV
ncbi:MAG TPA: AAA family ATPase [Actinomycetota bacterium]|nr:AAA family ATPase [Actinomycetota bacterium]